MAEPSILKDHQSEAQIYIERVSIGALVVVVLFGLLLARVGYLQFVRYDAFVTRSISVSPMTFPHFMMRVLIAEQLYRAWSINRMHPYHK